MRNMKIVLILFLGLFLLTACQDEVKEKIDDDILQVITSFTLIEDMVKQIGGDFVETHNLVPIGTDPHEYDPLPEDIKIATDADIIFYNGFNLEGNEEGGWIVKFADSIDKQLDDFYMLMDGAEPMYLEGHEGQPEHINPHTFLDPVLGIHMAENVRDALMENLPDRKEEITERAKEYIAELEEIEQLYEEKINDIPEENRILITSERAYQYMAARYGLEEGYIFQVDTEERGTPEQMTSLIEFIEEKEPPVLFVETNVDQRSMETISDETGVEIYGEVFSDEIGKPGEEGDTYVKFLRYNIEMIHEGLTSK
ncbi:MAG TPA: zinc ABC transporter substrate-binding protein [Bacillota bacterium]|nr:zinc ABC transporter substrate-binding protein [Bacillota bacterium]